MTSTAGEDRWRSLGTLLVQRRTALDPRYHNRGAFCEATGLKYRLVYDIEEARRTNFGTSTLAAIEAAYQLRPGAIAGFLAGGSLTPEAEPPTPIRPELAETPTFLTQEETVAALPTVVRIFDRIDQVRGDRDPAGLGGNELFGADDPVLAAAWDTAMMSGLPWIRAAWIAAAGYQRNARREQQGQPGRKRTRGALILV